MIADPNVLAFLRREHSLDYTSRVRDRGKLSKTVGMHGDLTDARRLQHDVHRVVSPS